MDRYSMTTKPPFIQHDSVNQTNSPMTMKFYNKRYFTRQNFEILKSSLKIERKNLFDSVEYKIPFDQISNQLKTQTIINNNLVVVGLFFLVFNLFFQLGPNDELTIIFFSIGLLITIISFINRKKVVTITAFIDGDVELYFNNRNKQEVVEYAHSIIKAADNYLLTKLTKVDRALPIEPQLENIQFLLNREIINEETFEILKTNYWVRTINRLLALDKTNCLQQIGLRPGPHHQSKKPSLPKNHSPKQTN